MKLKHLPNAYANSALNHQVNESMTIDASPGCQRCVDTSEASGVRDAISPRKLEGAHASGVEVRNSLWAEFLGIGKGLGSFLPENDLPVHPAFGSLVGLNGAMPARASSSARSFSGCPAWP